MNNAIKYFVMLYILVFAGLQVAEIVRDFSGTRLITVTKKVPNTETTELKGYHITTGHFEKANIKVQPDSFSDDLLLTSDEGNLLSMSLKIVACLCLAWYVFKVKPGNAFSRRSYWIISLAAIFYFCSVFAWSNGLQHTGEFWNNLYWHNKAGPAIQKGFFVIDDSNTSNYWIVTLSILFFIRYFVREPETRAALNS